MPHIIIEYSDPITETTPEKTLLTAVNKAAIESHLFAIDSVKTRLMPYKNYISAGHDFTPQGQSESQFIHITAKILDGRTDEQKLMLGDKIKSALIALGLKNMSLTIDVTDTIKKTYTKCKI